jgi:hypothetical protein
MVQGITNEDNEPSFHSIKRHELKKARHDDHDNCVNPLLEYDHETAPQASEQLDFSQNEFTLSGIVYNAFDTSDSVPLEQVCTQTTGSFNIKNYVAQQQIHFNASSQVFSTFIGTYGSFLNATSNYQMDFNITTGEITNCRKVNNYNWTTYMNQFKFMRRVGSVKMNSLKGTTEEYKTFFGRKHIKDINEQIADKYIGMLEDSSTPGPNSGCQRQLLSSTIFVSRRGREYGQFIPAGWETMSFFPYLHYVELSPRNSISNTNVFFGISNDAPIVNNALVDQYCQNALDYCTTFFNQEQLVPNEGTQ